MAFEILNESASVLYVLAGENRYPQAEPDKVDFDILVQGIDGEGVVSGCAVTPQGVPDTTVAVAAGVVRIAGTDVAYAGGNVNCGAAHAGFPRFDLIAINNAGVASAVAGVAAAPPVFPAVPANSVIVAAVWRAANDNTITAADIVDKRCMVCGTGHALVGGYYPSVLSVSTPNAVVPQVEYRGDGWTLTKLSCRLAVPPQGQAAKVKIWRNGASMGEVTIAAAAQAGEIVALSIAVSDKDYFEAEITQVGTTPNEGSDLHWQCVP